MRHRSKRINGFRSHLENRVASALKKAKVWFAYESMKLRYTVPESKHTYTPDFVLKSGIHVEVKGYLEPKDRKKHLFVQAQHPGVDIRFVFQDSSNPIYKGSKTTYADWCNKNGFIYAEKLIPEEWYDD